MVSEAERNRQLSRPAGRLLRGSVPGIHTPCQSPIYRDTLRIHGAAARGGPLELAARHVQHRAEAGLQKFFAKALTSPKNLVYTARLR